jgi:hypothetical protein
MLSDSDGGEGTYLVVSGTWTSCEMISCEVDEMDDTDDKDDLLW